MEKQIKAMSLFANVGIAESYLSEENVSVVIANELELKRAKFYSHLYPKTDMVVGDITDDKIKNELINKAKKEKIDLIMATPPCQGMSTVGKKDKNDIRNILIKHAIDIIKEVKPDYVFLENVPEQLITKIKYNNKEILIPDYIKDELGNMYNFNKQYVDRDWRLEKKEDKMLFYENTLEYKIKHPFYVILTKLHIYPFLKKILKRGE